MLVSGKTPVAKREVARQVATEKLVTKKEVTRQVNIKTVVPEW